MFRSPLRGPWLTSFLGSILLVLIMCVLVYLQSTAVLDWMVVK